MKILSKCILALTCTFFAVPAYAGTDAGEDSARYYKSNPDKFDGEKVDVDVAFVTRINRKTRLDGVVFFVAHTVDEDNHVPGGSIIVAVLEGDAEHFMRKYGTALERRGKVDTKRLRGTFHQLKRGLCYIDQSGEADALIEAYRKEHSDDVIPEDPEDDDGVPGPGPRKHKKF